MEGPAASAEVWLEHKCVFCKSDIADASPKLLPCFHGCCSGCVVADASERVRCPVCQQEFRQAEIIDNFFLRELQQGGPGGSGSAELTPTCNSCDDNATADSFCTDCVDWLCTACVQAHQRVRVTKDHVICAKSEVSSEQRGNVGQRFMICPTHKQEPLKLFCETCDTLTCRDCQLTGHRDHRYQFVSEACTQQKQQIHRLIQQLQQRRTQLESNKEASMRVYKELADREQFIREGIKQFAMKFISEIGQRSRQLVRELHSLCGQKKTELTAGHREVQTTLARLEHNLRFAGAALERGSDLALLYSKPLLLGQLRALLAPPVPPAPSSGAVDVRFIYENTSLVNYIRSLGTLVVGSQPSANTATGGFVKPTAGSGSPAPSIAGSGAAAATASSHAGPLTTAHQQLQSLEYQHRLNQHHAPSGQQHVSSSSSQTFRQQNSNLWNLLEKNQGPPNATAPHQQQQPPPPHGATVPHQQQQPPPPHGATVPHQQQQPPPPHGATAATQNHFVRAAYQSLPTAGLHNGVRSGPLQQTHHPQQQQQHQQHQQHHAQQNQNHHHNQQAHPTQQHPSHHPQQHPHHQTHHSLQQQQHQYAQQQHLYSQQHQQQQQQTQSPPAYRPSNTTVLSQMLSQQVGPAKPGPTQPGQAHPSLHGVVGSSSSSGVGVMHRVGSLSIVRTSVSPAANSGQQHQQPQQHHLQQQQQQQQHQSINIMPQIEIVPVARPGQGQQQQHPPPYGIMQTGQRHPMLNILSRSHTVPLTHYPQHQQQQHPQQQQMASVAVGSVSGGAVRVCSSPSVTTGLDAHQTQQRPPSMRSPAVGSYGTVGQQQQHQRRMSSSSGCTPTPSPTPSTQLWVPGIIAPERQCSPESAKKDKVSSSEVASFGLLDSIKREKAEEPEEEISLDKALSELCQDSMDTLMENIRKEAAKEAAAAAAAGEPLAGMTQDKPMQADSSSSPGNECSSGGAVTEATPTGVVEDSAGDVLRMIASTEDDLDLEILVDHQRPLPREPSAFVDLTLGDDLPSEPAADAAVGDAVPAEPEDTMATAPTAPSTPTAPTTVPERMEVDAPGEQVDKSPSLVPLIVETRSLAGSQSDDPNDDWCSVCHDGGDLLCCNRCPRVFHLNCHVPSLPASTMESDTWQCYMCRDLSPESGLSERRRRKDTGDVPMDEQHVELSERILLELFCHEASPPFHEPVSKKDVPDYHKIVHNPMALATIKRKLAKTDGGYRTVKEFVADLRLIISNCFLFNEKESEVSAAGRTIESFMNTLLREYLPWAAPEEEVPPAPSPPGSTHSSSHSKSRGKKRRRIDSDDSSSEHN